MVSCQLPLVTKYLSCDLLFHLCHRYYLYSCNIMKDGIYNYDETSIVLQKLIVCELQPRCFNHKFVNLVSSILRAQRKQKSKMSQPN